MALHLSVCPSVRLFGLVTQQQNVTESSNLVKMFAVTRVIIVNVILGLKGEGQEQGRQAS